MKEAMASTQSKQSILGIYILAGIAAIALLAAPFLILGAPTERTMGLVQKIFYFHVPTAWLLFLSTFVCAGGSIMYLFKGSTRGDRLANAAGELGVLFGICVLVSGPLWGRGAWGVYWQWDARLTSSLLLWLLLVAYLLARRYGGPAAKRLAASLSLFAAANVPLVYVSVNIWRTIHPQTSVVPTLGKPMLGPFFFSLAAMTVFWGLLLSVRMKISNLETELDTLAMTTEDAEELS